MISSWHPTTLQSLPRWSLEMASHLQIWMWLFSFCFSFMIYLFTLDYYCSGWYWNLYIHTNIGELVCVCWIRNKDLIVISVSVFISSITNITHNITVWPDHLKKISNMSPNCWSTFYYSGQFNESRNMLPTGIQQFNNSGQFNESMHKKSLLDIG